MLESTMNRPLKYPNEGTLVVNMNKIMESVQLLISKKTKMSVEVVGYPCKFKGWISDISSRYSLLNIKLSDMSEIVKLKKERIQYLTLRSEGDFTFYTEVPVIDINSDFVVVAFPSEVVFKENRKDFRIGIRAIAGTAYFSAFAKSMDVLDVSRGGLAVRSKEVGIFSVGSTYIATVDIASPVVFHSKMMIKCIHSELMGSGYKIGFEFVDDGSDALQRLNSTIDNIVAKATQ